MKKLKEIFSVHQLAKELGLQLSDDPIGGIISHCDQQIRTFLSDWQECDSLSDLLEWVASKLGTLFEEVRSDEDLDEIKQRYCDPALAQLEKELSDQVFGVTFSRLNREDCDQPYVSVIDCRGNKAERAYFTKWHELAHLLTLTPNSQIRKTHSSGNLQAPEESLMDVIASEFGFFSPFVHRYATGEISFDGINRLREQLCPEASRQSALIGFTKAWPTACVLVRAEMGLKKSEEVQKAQPSLFPVDTPKEVLRAVKVTINSAAREKRFHIPENMRIPQKSVIFQVNEGLTSHAEAVEDLSWWEASSGTVLPQTRIRVQARRAGNGVDAIIYPLD